jgi:uncharacterized protein YkwD
MLRTTVVLVVLAVSATPAAAAPQLLPRPPVPLPLPLLSGGAASPAALQVLGGDVVQEVNRVRAGRGLRPLRETGSLAASARRHSTQMGQRGFFDHNSADGTPFWRRIERFYDDRGFRSWAVGENIFWQSPTAIAAISVVRSWLASPSHRANMLSREWRDVGVGAISRPSAPGVYGGSPVTIVTVDFGNRRR